MKNKFLSILLLFPILIFSQTKVDVTYIANEGFLIENGAQKIIIDGLFGHIDGDWCDSPNEEMLQKMKTATAPFDEIDIIAVTHHHRDHFDKDVVMACLISHLKTKLICPNQVYHALAETESFEEVKDRVIPITPESYSDSNIVIEDFAIRVLRLEHSHYEKVNPETGEVYNKHRDVENLGFVFDIDGTKIFHCGDTNPKNEKEYQTFKLNKEDIDIAFLERQFISTYGNDCLDKIDEFIHPKHIFFMHIRPSNQDYFSDVFKDVSHVYVSKNMMETFEIKTK